MLKYQSPRLLPILALCTLFLQACESQATGNRPEDAETLTGGPVLVFAAASLSDAFEDLATAYSRTHPGAQVDFVFDGSQRLRLQLEHGAEADVFASADWRQMHGAEKAGVLAGEPQSFASNQLVFLLHRDSGFLPLGAEDSSLQASQDEVNSFISGLASPGTKIVVALEESPVGQYTDELLDNMSNDPEFGQGFADGFSSNIVSRETNVRGVVQKVALGEADAGIAYRTDALIPQVASRVVFLEPPEPLSVTADYPIAALSDTDRADQFIDFVLSAQGQSILSRHGFGPPLQ